MTTLNVTYTTGTQLVCDCTLPATVKLWVKDGLVAYVACEGTAGYQTIFQNFVEASLIKKELAGQGTCGPLIKYTFEYDSEDLQSETALGTSDILGVICEGALATYIDEKFGQEPWMELTEDGTYVFHSSHDCQFSFTFDYQSMPPSEPDDGDIPNSKLAFWIDEGTNTLNIKAKKSDGTIVTGSIALV